MQKAFSGSFAVTSLPDEFGSGFRGTLVLESGETVTVEVLSNYEDVSAADLTESSLCPGMIAAYTDVNPAEAVEMRGKLLDWIGSES